LEIIQSRLGLSNRSAATCRIISETLDRVFFADAEIDYGFYRGRYTEFRPIVMQIEIDAKGLLAALNLVGCPEMKNPHYRALGD
jgi:hypothetical protein